MKFFIPHRIKFLRHSAGTLFNLSNLYRHVRIAGAAFVFCYQTLSANDLTSVIKSKSDEEKKKNGFR